MLGSIQFTFYRKVMFFIFLQKFLNTPAGQLLLDQVTQQETETDQTIDDEMMTDTTPGPDTTPGTDTTPGVPATPDETVPLVQKLTADDFCTKHYNCSEVTTYSYQGCKKYHQTEDPECHLFCQLKTCQ